MIVRLLLDIETVAGMFLAVTFLLLHRPSRHLRATTINATGWVWIVLLAFVRTFAVTILRDQWRQPLGSIYSFDNATSIILGALVVCLMVLRLVSFLRFKKARVK